MSDRKLALPSIGFRAAMRFYEYEARKIVELAGIIDAISIN